MKLNDYCSFTNGFYIEVGANDGIFQSNTAYLETNLSWNGLLIEPNIDMLKKCMINRSIDKNIFVHSALVSFSYTNKTVCGSFVEDGKCTKEGQIVNHIAEHFDDHKIQELQTIRNTRTITCVPANTLQSILEDNNIKHIDLLSLDVEGYEEEVLKGINFEKNSPKFMLIETGNNRIREKNIDEYVSLFDYEMCYRLENDTFYKLRIK